MMPRVRSAYCGRGLLPRSAGGYGRRHPPGRVLASDPAGLYPHAAQRRSDVPRQPVSARASTVGRPSPLRIISMVSPLATHRGTRPAMKASPPLESLGEMKVTPIGLLSTVRSHLGRHG